MSTSPPISMLMQRWSFEILFFSIFAKARKNRALMENVEGNFHKVFLVSRIIAEWLEFYLGKLLSSTIDFTHRMCALEVTTFLHTFLRFFRVMCYIDKFFHQQVRKFSTGVYTDHFHTLPLKTLADEISRTFFACFTNNHFGSPLNANIRHARLSANLLPALLDSARFENTPCLRGGALWIFSLNWSTQINRQKTGPLTVRWYRRKILCAVNNGRQM